VLGRLYEVSSAYKKELTDALKVAKGPKFKNDLIMIWPSAVVQYKLGPKGFADDVNPHLKSYLKNDDKYGRTGIVVFDFITDSDLPSLIFKKNWRGIGASADHSFCSESNPCSAGQGDCDNHKECEEDLKCGTNNCRKIHGNDATSLSDCCYLPVGVGLSGDWSYCSGLHKCDEGEGDCDDDSHCKAGLKCGNNNCRSFFSKAHSSADCCEKDKGVKPGIGSSADWNFCTSAKPCDEGYGDCDNNSHCKSGLTCGNNNCKTFHPNALASADCCRKKTWTDWVIASWGF